MKSFRHIPVYEYTCLDEFKNNRPVGSQLIGIEMTEEAIPLAEFTHPKQAIYLLGAEDHGLSEEAKEYCNSIVVLPGKRCLNVSVAGSIVLYDRLSK